MREQALRESVSLTEDCRSGRLAVKQSGERLLRTRNAEEIGNGGEDLIESADRGIAPIRECTIRYLTARTTPADCFGL